MLPGILFAPNSKREKGSDSESSTPFFTSLNKQTNKQKPFSWPFLNMLNSRWKYKNKQNLKIYSTITCSDNPPVAQTVKRPPAMQETQVRSLAQEDPLEKEMATHSRTLAGESHGWRILVQATIHGFAKSRTRLSDFTFTITLRAPQ